MKKNYSGTVAQTFTIGKNGPTIFQGQDAPSTGVDGDLYIRVGNNAAIYNRVNGSWINVISDPAVLSKGTVWRGLVLEVDDFTDFVTVTRNPTTVDSIDYSIDADLTIDAYAADYTEVVLPTGVEGKTLLIKDETSRAGTFEIRILDSNPIDDQSYQEVMTDYGFVEVMFAGGKWNVIGR